MAKIYDYSNNIPRLSQLDCVVIKFYFRFALSPLKKKRGIEVCINTVESRI